MSLLSSLWLAANNHRAAVPRHQGAGAKIRRFLPCLEQLETRACPTVGFSLGPVANLTYMDDNQTNPTIAINPTNTQNLFSAATLWHGGYWGNGSYGIFATYSTDGGKDWNRPENVVGQIAQGVDGGGDGLPAAAQNTRAVFDSYGNLFLTYETGQVSWSGTSTSVGDDTLTDTNLGANVTWATNEWANQSLEIAIVGGKDDGDTQPIDSNTANTIKIKGSWKQKPDPVSQYKIIPGGIAARCVAVAQSSDGGQTYTWVGGWGIYTESAYLPAIATGPGASVRASGTSTGGDTSNTLNDTHQSWTKNQFVGDTVAITGGTGNGEIRTISGNSATQLTVSASWTTVPNETSTYQILTASKGSVWVMWYGNSAVHVSGAPVTGLGQVGIFNTPSTVAGKGDVPEGIAVGPTGQVAVSYEDPTPHYIPPPPLKVVFYIYTEVKPDGVGSDSFYGQTTVSTPVYTQTSIPAQGGQAPNPINAAGRLAYDRSSLHNGRLYLVYTDASGGYTLIKETHSDDNGSTWISAVNAKNTTESRNQFWPDAVVDQTTGYLAVTWYDNQNDDKNVAAEIFGSVSADGGSTFPTYKQIADGLSDGTAAVNESIQPNGGSVTITSSTLTDGTQDWEVDWTNFTVVAGGDSATILSNTENALTVKQWSPSVPPSGSAYKISPWYGSSFYGSQDSGDLGDYTGLDYTNNVFWSAWSDNSNSTGDNPDYNERTLDIYTRSVTVSVSAPAPLHHAEAMGFLGITAPARNDPGVLSPEIEQGTKATLQQGVAEALSAQVLPRSASVQGQLLTAVLLTAFGSRSGSTCAWIKPPLPADAQALPLSDGGPPPAAIDKLFASDPAHAETWISPQGWRPLDLRTVLQVDELILDPPL
jgi:hypothetical protein